MRMAWTLLHMLYYSFTAAQEVITINVQPGWKDGTRITYAGAGDELPGQPPQANLSGLASTPGTHIACQ